MQGMRELLRSSLGKSLSGLTPLDRLAAAWPVACGTRMAGHGVVKTFEDGRAVIEVADAAWAQQMRAMAGQLTGDMRRIAKVELREIHFEVAGAARSQAPRTRAETPAGAAKRPPARKTRSPG